MSTNLISDSQKQFIISSIKNNFRIDGRLNTDPQKIIITPNNLEHLLGSCLINIQSQPSQIHIYCGIKLKVQKQQTSKNKVKQSNIPLKRINQRVFLQLGCIKKLSQQQQLTRIYIQQYMSKYIINNYLKQFQQLLMIPQSKRHYLTINIQTYILSTPHISYLQYIFLCVKKAMQSIQMPSFNIVYNEITDEEVVDVEERNNEGKKQKPVYQGLEELKIVGVIGQNYVTGMTAEEYQSVDSCMLIALGKENKVIGFESLKGTLKVQQIHQIIKFAKN